jgi:hypothetical protein
MSYFIIRNKKAVPVIEITNGCILYSHDGRMIESTRLEGEELFKTVEDAEKSIKEFKQSAIDRSFEYCSRNYSLACNPAKVSRDALERAFLDLYNKLSTEREQYCKLRDKYNDLQNKKWWKR